jgi:hypothetical protein
MSAATCTYNEDMSAEEIAKLKRRAHQRDWYARNKDRLKEKQIQYYHTQQKINRQVLFDFYMKYHSKIEELERIFAKQNI